MSGALGPGDWVESVNHSRLPDGVVARVTQTIDFRARCRNCGITGPGLLLSIPHELGIGHCPNHWRPIYRPKADFIEFLLQPAPETEPA